MAERGQVQEQRHFPARLPRQGERLQHEGVGKPPAVRRIRHDVPGARCLLGKEIDTRLAEAVLVAIGAHDLLAGCRQLFRNCAFPARGFPDRAVERFDG